MPTSQLVVLPPEVQLSWTILRAFGGQLFALEQRIAQLHRAAVQLHDLAVSIAKRSALMTVHQRSAGYAGDGRLYFEVELKPTCDLVAYDCWDVEMLERVLRGVAAWPRDMAAAEAAHASFCTDRARAFEAEWAAAALDHEEMGEEVEAVFGAQEMVAFVEKETVPVAAIAVPETKE